jgi:anti-sigma B factor antagonist
MSVKLNTRQAGDVTVVQISGRIVLGEEAGALRAELRSLVEQGRTNILLNLRDVNYVDSSGVGELVAGFTAVRNRGGALKLTSLSKRLEEVLLFTKLYVIFEVWDDEAAAIHSFR